MYLITALTSGLKQSRSAGRDEALRRNESPSEGRKPQLVCSPLNYICCVQVKYFVLFVESPSQTRMDLDASGRKYVACGSHGGPMLNKHSEQTARAAVRGGGGLRPVYASGAQRGEGKGRRRTRTQARTHTHTHIIIHYLFSYGYL